MIRPSSKNLFGLFTKRFVVRALTLVLVSASSAAAAPNEFTDTVVASVNGKPITWSDVQARVGKNFHGTLDTAESDPRVRNALDTLILEQLIQEDADAKRLSASAEEVQAYIQEIAQRNNMNMEQFRAALAAEGNDFVQYTNQVRLEVLKGKLASTYLRGGVTVSEQEIHEVLKAQPSLLQRGSKVELAQIFVSTAHRSPDDAREIIRAAQQRLDEGTSFEEVVAEFSEGDEKASGGSLGMLNERELSREIFDAVLLLKPGSVSEPVETGRGVHLFKVLQRVTDEATVDAVRSEIRKQLQAQKVDEKINSFFTSELYKNHAVDKKI